MRSFPTHIILRQHVTSLLETKIQAARKSCAFLFCVLLCQALPAQFDIFAPSEDTVYTRVEQMPYFMGCEIYDDSIAAKRECSDLELVRFISRFLVYPDQARYNSIEGTVFVSFVIDENGEVTEPFILKDIGGGCGDAALDVIREMPKWESAVHQNQKVKVRMNLPIQFFLRAEHQDVAEQFSLSWGILNGQQTTKNQLLENLDQKLYVRGPEGSNRFVDEVEFVFEKENRLVSASSRGDITDELEKVVQRVKKGGTFTIHASVQNDGHFITVSRSFMVEK